MTYKVSFIPYVEVQLTNLLYNSIIGHDLLYGNSYAWSEEEKKEVGLWGIWEPKWYSGNSLSTRKL